MTCAQAKQQLRQIHNVEYKYSRLRATVEASTVFANCIEKSRQINKGAGKL
jgi:hypothetical protein